MICMQGVEASSRCSWKFALFGWRGAPAIYVRAISGTR
jgi:hypothetical protein